MQPEVIDAIGALRDRQVLSSETASHLLRVARGDLVSVRPEMRALLYLGVLLLPAGVGLFLKEHHDRIGPTAIASTIGLAAAACFLWVVRRAAPFTWGRAAEPGVAFDYMLLLGLLLAAADLAYLEVQFSVLGESWPYHLLVVAVLSGAAAFRWDSPIALSLALTSLAAWRGVSVNILHGVLRSRGLAETRWNAIACGVLFALLGLSLARAGRKPHFEEVWLNFGAILLFGGLLSGVFGERLLWGWWLTALAVVSAAVIVAAFRARRSLYFAEAVLAAYLGFLRLLFDLFERFRSGQIFFLVMAGSAAGVIGLIVAAHRRMRER